MSQTAETLRAIPRDFEQGVLDKEEIAACEAGARAWEIVQKLSEEFLFNQPTDSATLKKFIIEARTLLDAEGR